MIGTEKSADLLELVYIARARIEELAKEANSQLQVYEPLTLIFATILFAISFKVAKCVLISTYRFMLNFKKNVLVTLFNLALACPLVKKRLEKEE